MTMTMTTIMITIMIKPRHISFLVLFCNRLASTSAVVPEDTYSTDLATCGFISSQFREICILISMV